jgi:glycosyltransferase involved in cell wall biosynthesis
LLNGAVQVYCPSKDVKIRFQKLFPLANYRVIPHEELPLENIPYNSSGGSKLNIAILGILANHKGQKLVKEMVHEINQKMLPIQINLIGATEDEFPVSRSFLQTGKYQQDDLPLLLDSINPDFILFPTQCPETYSYTLSSAILSGRRIMAPNIGAFPERLRKINNAIIYPFNSNAKDLINLILKYLN